MIYFSFCVSFCFILGGEATPEDEEYCFQSISDCFAEVTPKKREVLAGIKGIHGDSRLFCTLRIKVLPFVEIRPAKQEDHDDLAEVFNKQSEMHTDVHGEFFIAEMIAGQSDTKKALVAQVKDKAVGLMVVTKDINIDTLHQCFKLESYDNLLKSDYMDAVRKRRDAIQLEMLKTQEENRKQQLTRLKEETIVNSTITKIEMQYYFTESRTTRILQRERSRNTEEDRG